MWLSMVWWGWCRSLATPSTSCSAPTSGTCGCSADGSRSSREFEHHPEKWGPVFGARSCSEKQESGSVLVGGLLGFDLARTARQREGLALIERADAALVEASFLDLQIGA